jgi:hypothetical protein
MVFQNTMMGPMDLLTETLGYLIMENKALAQVHQAMDKIKPILPQMVKYLQTLMNTTTILQN